MIWLFMVAVGVITLLIMRWIDKRKSPEEKQKEEEKLQRQREAIAEARELRKMKRQGRDVIVEVKYLGLGATTQKRGGLGGAMLGGFFAGPIGAVVGAALPKNAEGKHRFAVKYGNGRVEIKELHPNSWEYKKLMDMVKWEEL